MKCAALITALVAALAGFVSALLMIRGTAAVPWDMQSYKGNSDPEIGFRKTTRRYFAAGCILLAAAFAFSAVSAIASYLS